MTGSYCETTAAPAADFDRRSFRYVQAGTVGTWILIGCPAGEWNARRKRCKVGTRAHKIFRPTKGRCPAGVKRTSKGKRRRRS